MNNDEKILQALEQQGKALEQQGKALEQQGKALEALQADVANIKREAATKSDVHHLVQGQAQLQTEVAQIKIDVGHLKTGVEAVKAGLDDVRDRMATEAIVMDQNAKLDRITRNHDRRIEELEKQASLENIHKN